MLQVSTCNIHEKFFFIKTVHSRYHQPYQFLEKQSSLISWHCPFHSLRRKQMVQSRQGPRSEPTGSAVTFGTARSEDVLHTALSYFLNFRTARSEVVLSKAAGTFGIARSEDRAPSHFFLTAWGEDMLPSTPSYFLIFGQLGVRRYWPELLFTF
jgi:hypothetical protein